MNRKLATVTDTLHRDLVSFTSGRLSGMGLTAGLMYFILHTAKHPGCTPKELGDALGLDKAYVVRCLKKLVGDGFMERKPHPSDGRASLLYVTEKGDEVFRASHDMLEEWGTLRLRGLDEREKEQLFTLLGKIQTETKGRKS